ncbi:hypothetical protein B0H16DRAFT_1464770 [Mycena metata]|uniref:Uncharacterized protein n=1 Tax=Mycena metata TaxID=1033252 RepID=A0AAD7IDE9_9AGAR|nr:hypothetical protein B0H16DRAFT_1464770 [Mycena metata]
MSSSSTIDSENQGHLFSIPRSEREEFKVGVEIEGNKKMNCEDTRSSALRALKAWTGVLDYGRSYFSAVVTTLGANTEEHSTETVLISKILTVALPGIPSFDTPCSTVQKREFIPLESRSIIENGRAYCGRGGGLLAVELEVSVGIGRSILRPPAGLLELKYSYSRLKLLEVSRLECIIKSRVHGALQMASEGIYLRKGNQSDAASFIEGIDDYSRARTEKEHRETLHA